MNSFLLFAGICSVIGIAYGLFLAKSILKKTTPNGKVLGIDLDPEQIENCRKELSEFKDRLILVSDSYSNLEKIVHEQNFKADGILLDLGMSSAQLVRAHKGFSFKVDQGLDMRYNDEMTFLTAEKIVNEWPEEKIAEMQKKKKGLVKKVVSCDDEAIAKLTWEDVLELLKT